MWTPPRARLHLQRFPQGTGQPSVLKQLLCQMCWCVCVCVSHSAKCLLSPSFALPDVLMCVCVCVSHSAKCLLSPSFAS